jgi:hypothetical protein
MKHPEHELQKACVKWFRLQYPHYADLLFAIPNGGKRNAREAARLKAEGVTPGVPDLFLAVTIYSYSSGLWIEMKVGKNGLTENQRRLKNQLLFQGYRYAVCRSIEEFIETIENYLS